MGIRKKLLIFFVEFRVILGERRGGELYLLFKWKRWLQQRNLQESSVGPLLLLETSSSSGEEGFRVLEGDSYLREGAC